MTQNDFDYVRSALANKTNALVQELATIINYYNEAQKPTEAVEEQKETKKSKKEKNK